MSQSKLQVYTEEANPILETFLNELLGQDTTFNFGEANQTTIDQIVTEGSTAFSIEGNPAEAKPFIVQLQPEWIPVISNAMVGREMNPEEEGVFDLAGQLLSQGYEALQKEHSLFASAGTITVSAHQPGSWEPKPEMTESYWGLPLTLNVGDKTLSGNVYLPVSWVENLKEVDLPAAREEPDTAPEENNVGISEPKFPDFGKENVEQIGPGNFDLLAEVELNVTVELGRRKIPLSEVLKLTTGSVIELEKLVGEPLEIFANGRLIAEGEAVVIEEQFGIRITNLASNKIRARAFA